MIRFALPVLYAMLQLITHFTIGFLLRRRNVFSSRFFVDISRFVVRVALPIYYFVRLAAIDVDQLLSALFFPLAALAITTTGFLLSVVVLTLLGFTGRQKRAGIALGTFGNTGFMPLFLVEIFPLSLPVIEATFGITTPLLYLGAFSLVQSPLIWAFGNYLVAGSLKPPRIGELISPPVFGILAGLIVASLGATTILTDPSLPLYHIYTSLEKIGVIIFPLMIVCLGATIADLNRTASRSSNRLFSLAFGVAAVRLVALPLLFLALYFFFIVPLRLSPAHTWVLFLQLHIPPGTSLSIMAIQAGVNEENTAFVLLVNYVIYLFVLPVYVMILFSLPGVL